MFLPFPYIFNDFITTIYDFIQSNHLTVWILTLYNIKQMNTDINTIDNNSFPFFIGLFLLVLFTVITMIS